jgi:hypothetical protein
MWNRACRGLLAGLCVLCGTALCAPGAWASAIPTLSLDQSAGTTAGSTADLGMNLTFSDSGGDSPEDMSIVLPAGLLADADIDGGACLTNADLTDTNCQVGTGTVTADALGVVPLTVPVTFDLVPPPTAGDLAGLVVNDGGTQIGATADVRVRPSADPNGVGLTLDFVLPNSLDGAQIAITNIDSTFDGLRYPTSCPSTPVQVGVSVNSYGDSTSRNVTAPLSVTGRSSLPYAPKLAVSVAKDSGDREVALTTAITQAADEAPTGSLTLGFAGQAVGLNLASIKALCLNVASGTCTPVGVATATSPLYPSPLTAEAYLTGNVAGLTLTLMFPAPFPLTLVGKVDLQNVTTTFSGMPDIPLTNLSLKLNGGSEALFATNCHPVSGVVTAAMTDQNGDETVNSDNRYTIKGCAASATAPASISVDNTPTLSGVSVSPPKAKHLALSFKIGVGRRGSKLTALTVELPSGLRFVRHESARRPKISGIKVSGARVRSLELSGSHLVITLKRSVRSLSVKITGTALRESSSLRAKLRTGKAKSLPLSVIATNAKHRRYTIHDKIRVG